jgi:dipeptidyl-peptidase-4
MNIWHGFGSLALATCCWLGDSWGWQEAPRTEAESSGFLRTSTSQESQSFLEEVTKEQPLATLESIGETIEGRSLMTVRFAKPGTSLPLPPEDPRLVVLLLGNIHSGECDGKEALLAMVRDWCKEPPGDLLERLVVVFLPNYNADGNDRFGKLHRPGQGGPIEGMGIRENAQGFDLNRDFVKLQSPEARNLISVIDQWQVDALIDLHTTNGSLHRYPLTYDVPHNPAAPTDLVQWLHDILLPEATKRLKAEGIDSFYYGNFSADHKSWESFGFEPRYSTEYMGLRGRIGILSES